MSDTVDDALIDRVLAQVLALYGRRPSLILTSRHLDALFRDLAREKPSRDADTIEELIFAHWLSHPHGAAADQMQVAILAMSEGRLDEARAHLDRLCAQYPDWPEAFNKRATLAFIEGRDRDSLMDIERVLALEPRHFAAVSGFGQICLRNGYLREGAAALDVALRIDPHLKGLRDAIDEAAREAPALN